jgi:UDP-N-acetylmuramoyl-L-alanyl-D-glutamate--2,6-diaminopimelate ligase
MTLADLVKSIRAYRGLTADSRQVRPGFIFVAVKGASADGHRFIQDAIKRGAKAIVVQCQVSSVKCQDKKVNFVLVKDTRLALAQLAAEFYAHPSRKIKVVGVTGTNGKTTITYLLEALLKEAGYRVGVVGTVNYRFGHKVIPATNTTPGPLELQRLLAAMRKEKVEYLLMEVSSHSLDQGRITGIKFHSAIFTNLTQDHLDYHHTIENYFQAKSRLFRGLGRGAFAVINSDDSYGRRLLSLTRTKKITYGIEGLPRVRAQKLKSGLGQSRFMIAYPGGKLKIKTSLIGRHNVYNILSAAAWGLEEALAPALIERAIEKFSFVPGRLEQIKAEGLGVFVDYAHTEDALRNVISSLRPLCDRRLIVVFGCGGDRDKGKRPKMGRVVTEMADFAVITSDNPRSEEPRQIIRDIRKGIRKGNFRVVVERAQAIKESLGMARPGDILLIAGKGHEHYQVLKDRKEDFDDRKIVRECLKSLNY